MSKEDEKRKSGPSGSGPSGSGPSGSGPSGSGPPGSGGDFWSWFLGDALSEAASRLGKPLPEKGPAEAGSGKTRKEPAEAGSGKTRKEPAEAGSGKTRKEPAEAGGRKTRKDSAKAGSGKTRKEPAEGGGGNALPEGLETVPESRTARPEDPDLLTVPESRTARPEAPDLLTVPESRTARPEAPDLLTLPGGGHAMPQAALTAPEPSGKSVPVLVRVPVSDSIRPGETLMGTYRIDTPAIQGGMGRVWRVRHTGWDVDLAMKRPRDEFFHSDSNKKKFSEECRNWVSLGLHPNIVSCYYVREIEGVPTIFSEWMTNGSLERRIRDGSLYDGEEVQKRLLDIAIQFARGLRYAHDNELIHQDVKPDNLLLGEDWEAKVSDFGLAKARSILALPEGPLQAGEADPGATVVVPGGGRTPAYCSPEQASGRLLTKRTDLYSWAVSVLEMYLGSRPWAHGSELTGPMVGLVCRDYFAMCGERPVPEEMQELLAGCLEQKPERRPENFEAVEDRLLEIYRKLAGQDYPRPAPKAVSDTADSLNNRALSYLDIGQPEEAEKLWEEALRRDYNHIDSRFNRELHLVRSRQKYDHKAVEELIRFPAIQKAGLPEILARDGGGSSKSVLRGSVIKSLDSWAGFCYGRSFTESEMLFFQRPDSDYNGSPKALCLRHFDLKSGQETDRDLMTAVREELEKQKALLAGKGMSVDEYHVMYSLLIPGTSLMLTVLYYKNYRKGTAPLENNPERLPWVLHYTFYLCLYDAVQKLVTRGPVLLADLERGAGSGDILLSEPVIRKDGSQAAFHFYGCLGMKTDHDAFVKAELPSLRIGEILPFAFQCFLPRGRCLLQGRNVKRKMALQVLEADGSLREVFIFRRVTDKELVWGDGDASFLCYRYKSNGEIFRLDENFKRIPMDFLPMSSDRTFWPLKYDDREKLLYLLGYNGRLDVWQIEKQSYFSMPMSPKIGSAFKAVSYDPQSRVLFLADKVSWASVVLPLYRPEKASWRLSRIVTSRRRIAEEEQLSRMIRQFDVSMREGDPAGALKAYRICTGIPGFTGSPEAWKMGTALDPFFRKKKLIVLQKSEEINEVPDFALSAVSFKNREVEGKRAAFDYTHCASGLTALYKAHSPAEGIRLFSREGVLLRTVSFPKAVRYAAVRRDRIYAVTGFLECTVYDLDGQIIEILPQPRKAAELESEAGITALDQDGRNLLFKYKFKDALQAFQLWQLDLSTGSILRIQTSADSYSSRHFDYMKNQTIVSRHMSWFMDNRNRVPMVFPIIDRCSSLTGERLEPVSIKRISKHYPAFSVCAFPEEDRIWAHIEGAYAGLPNEMRLYDVDCNLIDRWEIEDTLHWAMLFPGSHFMAYIRENKSVYELCIRDVLQREDVSIRKISYNWNVAFRPDGCEIYVKESSLNDLFEVYKLEFEYE